MSNKSKREALSTFSKLSRYFKNDLKDIVWPDTMPNPPNYVEKKYTMKEHFQIWKKALQLYGESWKREFGEDDALSSTARTQGTRKYHDKGETEKTNNNDDDDNNNSSSLGSELSELAHTAKSGWRPLVKYLYETRGIAYRDGVREFIKEYKNGYQEVIESEKKSSSSRNSSNLD
jgi:hypothetical protein